MSMLRDSTLTSVRFGDATVREVAAAWDTEPLQARQHVGSPHGLPQTSTTASTVNR